MGYTLQPVDRMLIRAFLDWSEGKVTHDPNCMPSYRIKDCMNRAKTPVWAGEVERVYRRSHRSFVKAAKHWIDTQEISREVVIPFKRLDRVEHREDETQSIVTSFDEKNGTVFTVGGQCSEADCVKVGEASEAELTAALLERELWSVPEGWRDVVWSIARSGKSYECDAINFIGEVWSEIEQGLKRAKLGR